MSTPTDPKNDCPLPVDIQRRNIYCFASFWGIYYLAAPVSYVGLTHANLLKALGNNDTVCNLPSAVYLWLSIVSVLTAWFFPHPRYLKRIGLIAVSVMACITAVVAITLWARTSAAFITGVVIAHAAVFGAANGVLLTAMWDALKRGTATSRRGGAMGLAFGVGPLLACVGALFQDALFEGKMLAGRSFGLTFPDNYMAMFAAVAPLILAAGIAFSLFTLPRAAELEAEPPSPLKEIGTGLWQFLANRNVWVAVMIYVIVYSGGNAIFSNVSLQARVALRGEEQTGNDMNAYATIALQTQPLAAAACSSYSLTAPEDDTLGIQSFLRFGCKAVAGGLLGWLLAAASPRATLLATTLVLLVGMGWALNSTGWWFMATFGLLGAGELFGAYFPNYVTTASEKKFVRVNMAYLAVLTPLIGFSSLAFGRISDRFGRIASFQVAAGLLAIALALICVLLPADPKPVEKPPETADAG